MTISQTIKITIKGIKEKVSVKLNLIGKYSLYTPELKITINIFGSMKLIQT